MATKIYITICIQLFIIQTISSQSVGNPFNPANVSPGLIDGSVPAMDIAIGPNEMAFGPAANEIAYGPRITANEIANGPRIANEMAFNPRLAANELSYNSRMVTNEMAFNPRAAANEMAFNPRLAANELAYNSRMAANEMAFNPRLAANELAYNPRVAANEMAYGPRIAANEMAYGPRIAANEMAYGPKSVANEIAYGNMASNGLASDGLPLAGYGPGLPYNRPLSSGGSFPVTSSSRIAPTGITIVSENTIEGIVSVNGELPVLAAVSLQGSLPTSGSGSIAYGCGNGAVGIVNEGVTPAAAELAYGQRLPNEMDMARLGRVGCGSGV